MVDAALTPHYLLIAAFLVSATAGFSSLIRPGVLLTWRGAVSTSLFSGMAGLTIALILFSRYAQVDPYFLLGLCALATIGGPKTLDILLAGLQNAWLVVVTLSIKRSPRAGEEEPDDNP